MAGYNKYFKYPETKLFADLIGHIYTEKITQVTGGLPPSSSPVRFITSENPPPTSLDTISPLPTPSDSRTQQIQHLRNSPVDYPEELGKEVPPPPDVSLSPYSPEEWFNALQQKDDFRLVPGDVMRTSGKAMAFQILGHKEIWIPTSCVKDEIDASEQGLWIKEWFLKKKMEDIFITPV
ncbi:hypothetical protein [Candidatus Lokiarchaeum ossiferum]|uniref:hypothetical protein n=1 Tax=Candidatus Lokiarchaeum ossiferum TaxID=2951803 RepID=UPI00352ED973